MTDYVKEYRRLDKQVEQTEKRLEPDKWKLAQFAYEAVESGKYTQTTFAKAVNRDKSTIYRQVTVWAKYGEVARATRGSYIDAYNKIVGGDRPFGSTNAASIPNARAVLKDPDLARELLKDPTVRAVASEAISAHHRAQPATRSAAPSRDDAFLRCVDDMSRMEQSALRLIENLNEGRKNGFLSPSVLREFTEKLQLWKDAIDEIANSRGLTDEALAEWIGAE